MREPGLSLPFGISNPGHSLIAGFGKAVSFVEFRMKLNHWTTRAIRERDFNCYL